MSALLATARGTSALATRRERLHWPPGKPFRILSIDGGGIKGIYPAAALAEIEKRMIGGNTIGPYFDLIAGTSTGGIIALGLGKGHAASYLLSLYMTQGKNVFARHVVRRFLKNVRQFAMYMYNRKDLTQLVEAALGDTTMRQSRTRLCIPAFGAAFSEVAILKTPHHPSCATLDADKKMSDVAHMTAAAPIYFQAFDHGAYRYVDGGVWANNPTMIAVVEALTMFEIEPAQLRILSLGCGREPYRAGWWRAKVGGLFAWAKIMHAAMHLQSENAINQARLLAGPANVIRLCANPKRPIKLDDWNRASDELPALAIKDVELAMTPIDEFFLQEPADSPTFY